MENTMLIEVTSQKAVRALRELEQQHLIKVLKENIEPAKVKLSDKYRGVFSKEDAESFNQHTRYRRNEWNDTL